MLGVEQIMREEPTPRRQPHSNLHAARIREDVSFDPRTGLPAKARPAEEIHKLIEKTRTIRHLVCSPRQCQGRPPARWSPRSPARARGFPIPVDGGAPSSLSDEDIESRA